MQVRAQEMNNSKAEVAELRAELAEARRVQVPLAESQITSALPPGWEQFKDKNGRYLYLNHGTKQRSWMDPRLGGYASPTFDENFPGEKTGASEAGPSEAGKQHAEREMHPGAKDGDCHFV